MTNLLHIDASPRGARSHSRRLTSEFIRQWFKLHPDSAVIYRDVARNPPPHVNEAWIAAAFAQPAVRTNAMKAELRVSDTLIDELMQAEDMVMGLPMYNFGIPSTLKAYIDQIVRIGRTFLFEPNDSTAPYKPLLRDKTAYILVASGDAGYEPGGPLVEINQLEPYLRTVLNFIGIKNLHFIYQGNDEYGGQKLANSITHANAQIASVLHR